MTSRSAAIPARMEATTRRRSTSTASSRILKSPSTVGRYSYRELDEAALSARATGVGAAGALPAARGLPVQPGAAPAELARRPAPTLGADRGGRRVPRKVRGGPPQGEVLLLDLHLVRPLPLDRRPVVRGRADRAALRVRRDGAVAALADAGPPRGPRLLPRAPVAARRRRRRLLRARRAARPRYARDARAPQFLAPGETTAGCSPRAPATSTPTSRGSATSSGTASSSSRRSTGRR